MHGVRRMETRHEDIWSPLVLVRSVLPAHCGGEAGLGPGLAALHLEGAVLCSQQEGTPGQGGGGRDQHHQHCHHHLYTKLQPHRRHLGYGSHVKHSNNRCPEEQCHYCNIMLKMYIKSANLHFLLYATGKLETAFNFAH